MARPRLTKAELIATYHLPMNGKMATAQDLVGRVLNSKGKPVSAHTIERRLENAWKKGHISKAEPKSFAAVQPLYGDHGCSLPDGCERTHRGVGYWVR